MSQVLWSRMEARGRCRIWHALAVMIFLCSLALSLICFSWLRLTKVNAEAEDISEAKTSEVSRGSIFFNGEELKFHSDSGSTTEDDLLHAALSQSDRGGRILTTN